MIELYEWQKDVIVSLTHQNYVIVKKPRQVGFTTLAYHLINSYANLNKSVVFVSHNYAFAQRAKENFEQLYGPINKSCFFICCEGVKNYRHIIHESDLVIFDELAFYTNPQISLNISLQSSGKILIGSTPSTKYMKDGIENLFYRIWRSDNEFVKHDLSNLGDCDFIDQPKDSIPAMSSSKIEINQNSDETFNLVINCNGTSIKVDNINEFDLDIAFRRFKNIQKSKQDNFFVENVNVSYDPLIHLKKEQIKGILQNKEDVEFFKRLLKEPLKVPK